jgi:hypothetical protein
MVKMGEMRRGGAHAKSERKRKNGQRSGGTTRAAESLASYGGTRIRKGMRIKTHMLFPCTAQVRHCENEANQDHGGSRGEEIGGMGVDMIGVAKRKASASWDIAARSPSMRDLMHVSAEIIQTSYEKPDELEELEAIKCRLFLRELCSSAAPLPLREPLSPPIPPSHS